MTASKRLDSMAHRPDHAAIIDQVAALSREKFAPRAAQHDADASFPFDNYQDLREKRTFSPWKKSELNRTRSMERRS